MQLLLDSLRYTNAVLDPVHGIVRLSNEERSVLNHPLFQRLHRVRQNGLLYYVFPAASHTRFEHSLGVLHLAHTLIESLLRNGYAAERKERARRYDEAKAGEAVALHTLDEETLSAIIRIARLAGLVHDLGHGPLSHTFDSFAPKTGPVVEMVRTDPRLSSVRGLVDVIGVDDRPNRDDRPRVEHEEMSCVFFAVIWHQLVQNKAVEDAAPGIEVDHIPGAVAAAILNKPELCLSDTLRPFVPLLHDLVASAPLDADRMDYLERDSRSIGVTYGLYDRERVLRSLLPCTSRDSATLRLAVKRSGLRAVENFVQARFQLFVQVYYHKTNRATAAMLRRIAEAASESGLDLFTHDRLDDLCDEYLDLSDEAFLRRLRSDEQIPGDLRQLARDLSRRTLWKRVDEVTQADVAEAVDAALKDVVLRDAALGEDRVQSRKEAIRDAVERRLKTQEERLVSLYPDVPLYRDTVDPKATKDIDRRDVARILHRNQDGVYTLVPNRSWADELPTLRVLSEEEVSIGRLYYAGDDNDTLTALRRAALTTDIPR